MTNRLMTIVVVSGAVVLLGMTVWPPAAALPGAAAEAVADAGTPVGGPAVAAPASEASAGEDEEAPSWVGHDRSGSFIELDAQTQARIGLEVEPAKAYELQAETIAYGMLEEDPGESFVLRAPYAGYLAAEDADWPHIGARVQSGAVLGQLEVRLSALERLGLHVQWLEVQGQIQELTADLVSARLSFDDKKKLNEQGGVVSDRTLEEAETKLRVDEARLAAAEQRQALLGGLIGKIGPSLDRLPLSAAATGDVVDIMAQPGEAVESGQALLRLSRLDRLLARIELPIGDTAVTFMQQARMVLVGKPETVLEGQWLAVATAVGAETRGRQLLYRVSVTNAAARPGAAVVAYLPHTGPPVTGALVPRSAMLRYAGSVRVYVQTAAERFEPRDLVEARPTADGWFVTAGLEPGDRVVVQAAQVLLSEQLKVQIEQEMESEE